VGGRYAQALFDLATDEKIVAVVEADLQALKRMSAESKDFRTLLASPAFNAEDKAKALKALAAKAKLHATTQKFLGLLAQNGRVSALMSVVTTWAASRCRSVPAYSMLRSVRSSIPSSSP